MKLALYYDQLDSTKSEYERLSEALGQNHDCLIRAGIQTKGRGREGNSWHSPPGGLWFTTVISYPKPIASFPLYAGYVIHSALQKLFALPDLSIKWPNDIFLGCAKLAGVLCEYQPQHALYLIGIGINTNNTIDNAIHQYNAVNMIDSIGMKVSNSCLTALLNRNLRENLPLLEKPNSYLDYCTLHLYGRGKLGRITQGNDVTEGVIDGITQQGYLLLSDLQGKVQEIISGTLRLV